MVEPSYYTQPYKPFTSKTKKTRECRVPLTTSPPSPLRRVSIHKLQLSVANPFLLQSMIEMADDFTTSLKRPRPRAEDFTVAWICALPVELTAAEAMLDDDYEDINDDPQYKLGRIGRHNVVIVCLPAGQIGSNSATEAAVELRYKFPAVKIGLMVGIGGGVPSAEADIRLGDVVVSQPQGPYGGVVQYDFGKIGSDGSSIRTGSLNAPPRSLLTAISRLQSNRNARRSHIPIHLSSLSDRSEFHRRNAGPDILFPASYSHVVGSTCDQCDKDMEIRRPPRESEEPVIHFGTIASGNKVVKDGHSRDRLSSELGGVLCFEMEAAGLMNSLPSLVIRGISDYADSHKNSKWQPFAAAAAAACAKEILSSVPTISHVIGTNIDLIRDASSSHMGLSRSNTLYTESLAGEKDTLPKQHSITVADLQQPIE